MFIKVAIGIDYFSHTMSYTLSSKVLSGPSVHWGLFACSAECIIRQASADQIIFAITMSLGWSGQLRACLCSGVISSIKSPSVTYRQQLGLNADFTSAIIKCLYGIIQYIIAE